MVKPPALNVGKGLAGDLLTILGDFFNGAYGDSPLPAQDLFGIVAAMFLYLPNGLSRSNSIFNVNLQGKLSGQMIRLLILMPLKVFALWGY